MKSILHLKRVDVLISPFIKPATSIQRESRMCEDLDFHLLKMVFIFTLFFADITFHTSFIDVFSLLRYERYHDCLHPDTVFVCFFCVTVRLIHQRFSRIVFVYMIFLVRLEWQDGTDSKPLCHENIHPLLILRVQINDKITFKSSAVHCFAFVIVTYILRNGQAEWRQRMKPHLLWTMHLIRFMVTQHAYLCYDQTIFIWTVLIARRTLFNWTIHWQDLCK